MKEEYMIGGVSYEHFFVDCLTVRDVISKAMDLTYGQFNAGMLFSEIESLTKTRKYGYYVFLLHLSGTSVKTMHSRIAARGLNAPHQAQIMNLTSLLYVGFAVLKSKKENW